MKLKDFYTKMVAAGMKADPRSAARLKEVLKLEKERYDKLSKDDKSFYDCATLDNPYADSRLLHGDGDVEVRTIMVGIDIDVSEVVLADRLKEKGHPIDLIVAHHPEGHAYAQFYDVMRMQADIFNTCGVPIVRAEALTEERLGEVRRSVSSSNHMKTVDAARLLDIPMLCMHTPADNHVVKFLNELCKKRKPTYVRDIMKLLKDIPEYKEAMRRNAGPFVLSGSESARCGKVFVDMTGGTEGSRDIFAHLASSGVGTIVAMHLSEAHLKKAKDQRLNVINAGHISSDNLGINLILDQIIGTQKIEVVDVSGFRRVVRK